MVWFGFICIVIVCVCVHHPYNHNRKLILQNTDCVLVYLVYLLHKFPSSILPIFYTYPVHKTTRDVGNTNAHWDGLLKGKSVSI